MLLFLFRLLKYLSDSSLEMPQYIKLILFRHRSFLENQVERIVAEEKIERSTSETYKEFQYLKSRFDETYLHKEQPSPGRQSSPNHQIMRQLNELANTPINDPRAVLVYKQIILDTASECEEHTCAPPPLPFT